MKSLTSFETNKNTKFIIYAMFSLGSHPKYRLTKNYAIL